MRRVIHILLLASIVLCAPAVSADWTNLGIYGGRVLDIAVDPQNPDKLFAATYLGGGLFESQDGGSSWQVLKMAHLGEGEDTFEDHAVFAVDVAASKPQVVWATHNYWAARSLDGGQTWTHIKNSTMQSTCTNCGGESDSWRLCRSLAIDPQQDNVIYIGADGPYGGGIQGAVYKSVNSGGAWTKLNQVFDYRVQDLAVDPDDSSIVWAVTNSDGAGGWNGTIYRSANGGTTWQPITVVAPMGGLSAVVPRPDDPDDPDDPPMTFVASGYGVVLLTYEGGQWNASFPLAASNLATDIKVAPQDPNTVYACWMRPQAWGGDGVAKLSKGTYDGDAWSWQTEALDTEEAVALQTIAIHPTNDERVFGGDDALGMLRTNDHGQNWTPINQGLDAVIVYDLDARDDDSRHMIAASGSGFFELPAGSDTWQRRSAGEFKAAEFQPGSATTYYAGGYGQLLRTSNNGADWQSSTSLGPAYVTDIDIDPSATNNVFLCAGNQVWRSRDSGATLSPVLDGINLSSQSYQMNSVVIDPSDSQRLLAGGGNFYIPRVYGDLWESRNGGDSWQRTGLSDVVINAVLIDPRDADVLYAGCGYSANFKPPLFKSIDGGVTWTAAVDGLPAQRVTTYDIWASAADDVVYVGQGGNVFHYDGTSVSTMESATTNHLYGVYGLSATAIWAVGAGGTIIHYDGNQWSAMSSGIATDLSSVWASASNDVFAVGAGGMIVHYDGSTWNVMGSSTTDNLTSVFGISANHVIAVSDGGTIVRYNGSNWSDMGYSGGQSLLDVWGLAADDYYAVGRQSTVLHYDGANWSSIFEGNLSQDFQGVWGAAADDLYVGAGLGGLVLHYDGSEWTQTNIAGTTFAWDIWGVSADAIFLHDDRSGLFQFTGSQWIGLQKPGTTYRSVTDLAFHITNPDIVYAGTVKAGVFVSPNQGGHWLDFGLPPSYVYAISAGSLYAATGSGVYALAGTGVIAGNVRDIDTAEQIDGATVSTDLGNRCLSVLGEYMMVVPSGIFDVYATADSYQTGTALGLTVTGSDVTWQDFDLAPGSGSGPPGGGSSGGGSGCFVHTAAGRGHWGLLAGIMIVLPFGMRLWTVLGLRRQFFFILTPVLIFGVLISMSARAATVFQQVGVASPPVPVGSGARAMAMGGAFIATADDATAASWNPAGLIQLERPELSLVGSYADRHADYTSEDNPEIQNDAHDSDLSLNYFSFTYPLSWIKNLVLSINYQRLYDFERSFSHRFSFADSGLDLEQEIAFDQSGHVGAAGLAGAIELTPEISLGLTLNIWTDKLGWHNGWQERYRSHAVGNQGGTPVTIDTVIEDRYESFNGFNFNLGFLWETRRFGKFGVVIKTPFTASIHHIFEFRETTVYGPPTDTTIQTGPLKTEEDVELQMPLAYGVGWAMRFGDALTLGADIHRTRWQDYILTDGQGNEFSPIDGRPANQSDVDATTHVRIGGEYVVIWPGQRRAIPIRAGLFYDPEPSQRGAQDYYGLAVGGGVTGRRSSIDVGYQLRWGPDVDTGNLIAESRGELIQHTLLASVIYYF